MIKKLLITLLSVICLLGLTTVLSATVFKEELAEWVIKQKMKKYEQIKTYYVSEIPVEPENFAMGLLRLTTALRSMGVAIVSMS